MDEIIAFLTTPEILVLIVYLVGAAIIGATVIVGVMFISNYFGWLS